MTLIAYVDGERVDPGALVLEDSTTGECRVWYGHGVEGLFLGYQAAQAQLDAIEALLGSDRARLDEAHRSVDTADLVKLALEDRESHAANGWGYAGVVENGAAVERARFAAYLASRAPAGMVRVTVEGAAGRTGNGSAYIVGPASVVREADGHRYDLAEFLLTWLAHVVEISLEDAEEAARDEGGAGVAGCSG